MKKSDIITLVFIASISVIVAFFVAKAIFPNAYSSSTKVKTITSISSNVDSPRDDIFNKSAINPAVKVQITSGTQ
jgi:hypothetical protein